MEGRRHIPKDESDEFNVVMENQEYLKELKNEDKMLEMKFKNMKALEDQIAE